MTRVFQVTNDALCHCHSSIAEVELSDQIHDVFDQIIPVFSQALGLVDLLIDQCSQVGIVLLDGTDLLVCVLEQVGSLSLVLFFDLHVSSLLWLR